MAIMNKELNDVIWKHALKNALEHEGKAQAGAVVGKVLALFPEAKKDLAGISSEIKAVVEKVNKLKLEEARERLKLFEGKYELQKKEKREGLPELEWFISGEEKCRTRFAPNPNGPFHLGGARQAILSWLYARKYNGEFILRFDDTDPKIKKPIPNAYEMILEDLAWLGIKPKEVYYASDRMEIYYEFMKKAIDRNAAYVCTCNQEEWHKLKEAGEACPCRQNSREENLNRFEKMLGHEFKEGQAVLVIKTDLNHPDPSIRDWIAARIVDEPDNPKVGKEFKVWPMYNFASAVDDHETEVTLIIRGQEHAQNTSKQKYLYDAFGWAYPHSIHTGRLSLEGVMLSKSLIKEGFEKGEIKGWDDVKLGTIRAFKRRGYQPEALAKLIEGFGIKPSDVTVSSENLNALNRDMVKDKVLYFAFIQDPIRVDVGYSKEALAKFPLHPDHPEKGSRNYEIKEG
ncbi:glutamate--tRNA ligase, partial [archaeon]|nr:glutamate--tRNA ligase [archaeon]